jgi:hypothetical protein
MKVETGPGEWTLTNSLLKVLAVFITHLRFDPELGWDYEVRGNTTLRTRSDGSVVELLGLPPLPDARQTENVGTLF